MFSPLSNSLPPQIYARLSLLANAHWSPPPPLQNHRGSQREEPFPHIYFADLSLRLETDIVKIFWEGRKSQWRKRLICPDFFPLLFPAGTEEIYVLFRSPPPPCTITVTAAAIAVVFAPSSFLRCRVQMPPFSFLSLSLGPHLMLREEGEEGDCDKQTRKEERRGQKSRPRGRYKQPDKIGLGNGKQECAAERAEKRPMSVCRGPPPRSVHWLIRAGGRGDDTSALRTDIALRRARMRPREARRPTAHLRPDSVQTNGAYQSTHPPFIRAAEQPPHFFFLLPSSPPLDGGWEVRWPGREKEKNGEGEERGGEHN